MKILIDSREQRPFFVTQIGNPEFEKLNFDISGLETGDYSIRGMHNPDCEHSICIERKSLPDLFMSCGNERARFERELKRMSGFDTAILCIEGDLTTILSNPPDLSSMLPKSVFRSLIAWSQRYNIHIWACPGRMFAEKFTYISLLRFWEDRQKMVKWNSVISKTTGGNHVK